MVLTRWCTFLSVVCTVMLSVKLVGAFVLTFRCLILVALSLCLYSDLSAFMLPAPFIFLLKPTSGRSGFLIIRRSVNSVLSFLSTFEFCSL